jgi:hypothetical protein
MTEEKLIKNVELASKIVLKEDEKLFKELGKEQHHQPFQKFERKGDADHPYATSLEKFHGKIIEVKDMFGDCHRGICIAINKPTLHVVLQNEMDIVIIKNVSTISRNIERYEEKKRISEPHEIKIETIIPEKVVAEIEMPKAKTKRKRKKDKEESKNVKA